jgi:hypothetical protein
MMTANNSLLPALKRTLAAVVLACALAQAHAQPTLQSVSPVRGATQVPVTSQVVFTFDTPMSGATPIEFLPYLKSYLKWSAPVTVSQFTYAWNAELTVLTCTFTGTLPGSTLITWTLNPADATAPLTDENGQPLPMTTGSFTTAASTPPCDPDGIPDTFGTCYLTKSVSYEQTSASTPTLSTNELPMAVAVASSPAANPVTAATLRMPNSTLKTLTSTFGRHFLSETFVTQALLDTDYPAGAYQMSMTRPLPPTPTLVPMTMPAASGYPPIPQLANYSAAQSINSTQAFTLQWNAFPGVTGMDGLSLTIWDAQDQELLSAPDLCLPLPLPNTATSFVLPAGLFQANATYRGQLAFAKSFYYSTNTPADFATAGSLMRSTTFPLKTLGSSTNQRPVFDPASLRLSGGKFQFTLTNLVAGQTYFVEYSTTLLPNSWNPLLTTNPSTTSVTYTDPGSGTGHRAYRARKN